MQKYETLFVIDPTLAEEERTALIERVKALVEAKGKIEKVDEWGIRKLAYKINNKFREGYYVLIEFEAGNDCLDELNHVFRITENIIRDIIVKRY